MAFPSHVSPAIHECDSFPFIVYGWHYILRSYIHFLMDPSFSFCVFWPSFTPFWVGGQGCRGREGVSCEGWRSRSRTGERSPSSSWCSGWAPPSGYRINENRRWLILQDVEIIGTISRTTIQTTEKTKKQKQKYLKKRNYTNISICVWLKWGPSRTQVYLKFWKKVDDSWFVANNNDKEFVDRKLLQGRQQR